MHCSVFLHKFLKVGFYFQKVLVQFSHSVVSASLRPHELQHARLPCPSPTPRAYSNSCPSSRWSHPTISSSATRFFCLQSPSIRVFSSESVRIRWSKYWSFSFSISPSNEYSGLTSFRLTGLISLLSKGSQESSPAPQFESISPSALSLI